MVGTTEGVIEFMAQRQKKEHEEKAKYGSTIVRLDIYLGSPTRYRDIDALLRAFGAKLVELHAIGRQTDMDERDISGLAVQYGKRLRNELADMDPKGTIKKAGVPNSAYRRKTQ